MGFGLASDAGVKEVAALSPQKLARVRDITERARLQAQREHGVDVFKKAWQMAKVQRPNGEPEGVAKGGGGVTPVEKSGWKEHLEWVEQARGENAQGGGQGVVASEEQRVEAPSQRLEREWEKRMSLGPMFSVQTLEGHTSQRIFASLGKDQKNDPILKAVELPSFVPEEWLVTVPQADGSEAAFMVADKKDTEVANERYIREEGGSRMGRVVKKDGGEEVEPVFYVRVNPGVRKNLEDQSKVTVVGYDEVPKKLGEYRERVIQALGEAWKHTV